MIVLAVLLLLAVALVVLFVVVTGITPTVQLEWSQINTTVTLTALAVFLLGAVCLLVAEFGLALLLRGNRKNWERRRELKRLRRVEAERARHAGAAGAPATAPTGAPATTSSTGPTTTPVGRTTTGGHGAATGADAPAATATRTGPPDGARGGASRD